MTQLPLDGMIAVCVWLVVCVLGLFASTQSLKYSRQLLVDVIHAGRPADTVEGFREHTREMLWRVGGWTLFLFVGALAAIGGMTNGFQLAEAAFRVTLVTPSTPQPTADITPISVLFRWLLVSAIVAWGWKTVSEYRYTRRQLLLVNKGWTARMAEANAPKEERKASK